MATTATKERKEGLLDRLRDPVEEHGNERLFVKKINGEFVVEHQSRASKTSDWGTKTVIVSGMKSRSEANDHAANWMGKKRAIFVGADHPAFGHHQKGDDKEAQGHTYKDKYPPLGNGDQYRSIPPLGARVRWALEDAKNYVTGRERIESPDEIAARQHYARMEAATVPRKQEPIATKSEALAIAEVAGRLGYHPGAKDVADEYRTALADQAQASPKKKAAEVHKAAINQVADHYETWNHSRIEAGESPLRTALEAERNAIVATLSHIQEIPVAERPLGIETKYGRVIEIGRELGVKDPYTQGYEAEKKRLAEIVPRTVEQMAALAEKEERLSGPRAHAEIVINRNGKGATDDEFQYLRGEKAAIEHWTFEQRPRLVVATELERYAERVSQPHYVNAEEAMARNFADQLAAGRKDIDLSQHYATDVQEKASDRHVKAVENLWPLIEEARNHGYMVTTGHAITQQQKHAEVMAISEGMRI